MSDSTEFFSTSHINSVVDAVLPRAGTSTSQKQSNTNNGDNQGLNQFQYKSSVVTIEQLNFLGDIEARHNKVCSSKSANFVPAKEIYPSTRSYSDSCVNISNKSPTNTSVISLREQDQQTDTFQEKNETWRLNSYSVPNFPRSSTDTSDKIDLRRHSFDETNPIGYDFTVDKKKQSLQSLDELSENLKQKQQVTYVDLEDDESFATVIGNRKDEAAATDNVASNRNNRNHNIIVSQSNDDRSLAPPPYSAYDMSNNYHYGNPYRHPSHVYYEQQSPPRNASRAPPYRLNDPIITMNLFDDALIRKYFIAKVYSILSLQLLATFALILFSAFHRPTKLFFVRNYILLSIVSMILFMALMISFVCCESARRIVPLNYILLVFLTVAMSILAATATSIYSTYIILLSFAVTALVCTLVTILACLPCFDITGYFIYLFIAGIILLVYGLIASIVTILTGSNVAYMIYAGLATVLFCMYLIFDTQQLMAGKRVQLSPEEYILGAISLYVDIIVIFLNILTLCGNR